MNEYQRKWLKTNYTDYRIRRDAYEEAHKEEIEKYQKEYNIINRETKLEYAKKSFRYKNKKIHLKENPRTGVCYFCNKQNTLTHIHHIKYDDNDPLANTIELCRSCHTRWHRLHPTPEGYINPNHKNKTDNNKE